MTKGTRGENWNGAYLGIGIFLTTILEIGVYAGTYAVQSAMGIGETTRDIVCKVAIGIVLVALLLAVHFWPRKRSVKG